MADNKMFPLLHQTVLSLTNNINNQIWQLHINMQNNDIEADS